MTQPKETINVYEGFPDGSVTVNGKPLDLCLNIRNHSPTGFSWGYAGSGPAQLALAILCHEYGQEYAVDHYQQFKFNVIALLVLDAPFRLTTLDTQRWREYIDSQCRP